MDTTRKRSAPANSSAHPSWQGDRDRYGESDEIIHDGRKEQRRQLSVQIWPRTERLTSGVNRQEMFPQLNCLRPKEAPPTTQRAAWACSPSLDAKCSSFLHNRPWNASLDLGAVIGCDGTTHAPKMEAVAEGAVSGCVLIITPLRFLKRTWTILSVPIDKAHDPSILSQCYRSGHR